MEQIKKKIILAKNYVKKGQLNRAINILENVSGSFSKTSRRNIELLQIRILNAHDNKLRGKVSEEQGEIDWNILTDDILDLIENLNVELTNNNKKSIKNDKLYLKNDILFWLLTFIMLLYISFLYTAFKKQKESVLTIQSSPTVPKDSIFEVLIFPFNTNIGVFNQDREVKIHHLVASKLEELKDIKVTVDDSLKSYLSFHEADSIGTINKVDLVIWGEIAILNANSDSIFLNVKYQTIEENKKYSELTYWSDRQSSMRPYGYQDLVTSGQLTLKIENLINWILGNQASKENNWSKAIDFFSKVIVEEEILNRDKATIFNKIAFCHIALNETEKAKNYLMKSINLSPDSSITYSNLATVYHIEKELDSSFYYLSKAISINPNDNVNYGNRSHIYTKKKEFELALKDINKALSIAPDFIFHYGDKASILEAMERYQDALDYYRAGIDVAKKHGINAYISSRYYCARVKIYIKLYELEKKGQKHSLDKNGLSLPWIDKANNEILLAKKEQINEHVFLALGYYYIAQSKYKESIINYSNAIKILELKGYNNSDKSEALNGRGVCYLRLKDYEKANSDFSKALEIEENPYIYRNRAYCLVLMGRKDKAEEDNDKAKSLEMKNLYWN